MAKRILRLPEILQRLPIGKTKFDTDYVKTGKVRWINLGPRTKGLTEEEGCRTFIPMVQMSKPHRPGYGRAMQSDGFQRC